MEEVLDRVRQHYEAGSGEEGLIARIKAIIATLGDDEHGKDQLSALDHFHFRGREATQDLAEIAGIEPGALVLDAGSGLGGPSRFLAANAGCIVEGVDLSPSFVEVASFLAARAGHATNVSYQTGSIAALPFADATFDAIWTEHVVMNLPDRASVYREFRRVLKDGGKLAFYDPVLAEQGTPPHFPVPWAETAETSFLLTERDTIAALEAAGFSPQVWKDVSEAALAAFSLPSGGAGRQLAGLGTVMGPRFAEMGMNFVRNISERRVRLVMGVAVAAS
jgi:SAM-dependent methyltransferase